MFIGLTTQAQTITLSVCLDSTMVNYPLSKQAEINNRILQTDLQRISNTNLPQVDFTGKATWQSEVMELPITIPGMDIPDINKDQYKAQLEINQALYKGGLTKAQKQLSQSTNAISNAEMEVSLNNVKHSVIMIYYQILLTKDYIKVSKTYVSTLESKLGEMSAQIEAGVLLPTMAEVIKAEKLTIEQKNLELEMNISSLIKQMEKYTGISISPTTEFAFPKVDVNFSLAQQRPEYQLMELSQQKMDAMKTLNTAQYMPKAFAFSTLGYGRPGFNYLSNDFAPYAMVGVGFNWPIWNWGAAKKQKDILDFNKGLVEVQKETFILELNTKLIELRSEIEKQQKMLKKAQEIVTLRKSVAETTDNQLKNGIVTPSRYIDELQKYEKAKLEVQIYKIKLSIAQTNYLWALGRL